MYCVSDLVRASGFKMSMKYSLHRPRISTSLLSKTRLWHLMDLGVCDMLPRRRWMVWQNIMLAYKYSNWNPVYSRNFTLLHFRLFQRERCVLSDPSVSRMQRRVNFALKPCFVGYTFFAGRYDEIRPEMLKTLNWERVLWLTRVCQVAWCSAMAPIIWKTGMIIPVCKTGDRRECTNYRCIPLISLPWKHGVLCVLEKDAAKYWTETVG